MNARGYYYWKRRKRRARWVDPIAPGAHIMSATATKPAVKTIPIFRGGKWVDSRAKRTAQVFNPSTGAVIANVPLCDAKQTGEVVATAEAAIPAWAETPVVERARLMFRFRAL